MKTQKYTIPHKLNLNTEEVLYEGVKVLEFRGNTVLECEIIKGENEDYIEILYTNNSTAFQEQVMNLLEQLRSTEIKLIKAFKELKTTTYYE